jgi:PAS domain S-box-containing protein
MINNNDAMENFETIWEHVECGIMIIDAETREILNVNPVAARIFGEDKTKLIGRKCHKFICPTEGCDCPIMDKGQVVDRSERTFIKADGSNLPIIKSVVKINYNGKLALLESFTDISNLKEAEEKLLQLGILEQSGKAKSDFLSRMTHEIRTPINAIVGMTKIAENTSDIEKLKYCISSIGTSSQHLLDIINDVLDMSKIESGKFELYNAPMSLEKMLSKICGIFADMMEQKGIKFGIFVHPETKVNYIADEMRLSQAIANLLSNAIKFTPQGGSVKLAVKELEKGENDSILRFSVTDTGIGMTEDQIRRLFQSFEQADNSISRNYGGTGLGLTISQTIVEKMDGKIWAESVYGKGSLFIFDVRLAHDNSCGRSAGIQNLNPADIKALVIESETENREYMDSILRSFGMNPDTAATGTEAVQITTEAAIPYDVIFLDAGLTDSDALETAKKLKAQNEDTVIIMTSFACWNQIEEPAQQAGVARVLLKPVLPSSVLDAINELVGATVIDDETTSQNNTMPNFSGRHLLLAEDVGINREIFISLFENSGLDIDIAENGAEAVQKFGNAPEKYDLILMDIQMPEMDGYEATKQIRSMDAPSAKTIPIIALSANVFKEDIEKSLEAGMNDHLGKPIEIQEVIKKLKKFMKKGGARRKS